MTEVVRVGTRGSALARRQTEIVADLLRATAPHLVIEIQVITTRGDQVTDVPLADIGGEGVFTGGLESALLSGEIDVAVHSLKDLPVETKAGLIIPAVPERANPADALLSRAGYTLSTLPQGARVGTSSKRRSAQLRWLRPHLIPLDIRGNVDTRIAKAMAPDGPYDAIVLACAGLERLGRLGETSDILPISDMPSAPGQGALAVQCRDEAEWQILFRPLNHLPTELAVAAERAFLAGLGGGCSLPVAAYGRLEGQEVHLTGCVTAPDGSAQIHLERIYRLDLLDVSAALRAGQELASEALAAGARQLLEGV